MVGAWHVLGGSMGGQLDGGIRYAVDRLRRLCLETPLARYGRVYCRGMSVCMYVYAS
jgi:hypothetical protein